MNADQVVDFWIGPLNSKGLAGKNKQKNWFQSSVEFDLKIRENFGTLLREIENGMHQDWLDEPSSALAYVITLDQFSRNIYRGSAKAFSQDTIAIAATLANLSRASELPAHQRFFLYMPLMHSEQLTYHEQLEAILKQEIADSTESEVVLFWQEAMKSALQHRQIIEQFSRYPYRNETLGRESTAEEVIYLEQGTNRFGQ